MKTLQDTPEKDLVLDTSKMSAGQRAAIEMTEAARDDRAHNRGFAATLFMGAPDHSTLLPFPKQTAEDKDQGDAFLARLKRYLDEHVDPDAIDRDGEIPDEVLKGLADLDAFEVVADGEPFDVADVEALVFGVRKSKTGRPAAGLRTGCDSNYRRQN